ncbi:MAG TPA: ATP-grasp domain-containing protein [Bacteroidales bacterium]|nr:ATP-grasp domain-containing protein [Bacteroidales bacterium]HPS18095.1 ATP-grasp domain-containing protein [Bacteroidales bacterium]
MGRKKITIAVTGLNATDNPGPGIPVIRALKESEYFDARIIGLAYELLEPGIYMHNLIDKTYRIPYPSAGTESITERLKYINEKENINVLIPNFDAELFSFIKLEAVLKEMGIQTFLPTAGQFEERSKINLEAFGMKYDLKVPSSKIIYSIKEIKNLSSSFDFPVVVKGRYYDAFIAYEPQQVISFFNNISAKWGLPVIIQQYINGSEYNVIALGDGKGNTIGAVPMRKQYITDKGKAWAGIAVNEQELLKMTHDIIRKTKWRGALELELMKTKDNEFHMLEINPRIPAWVYLAVGAGQNIPEALVKLAINDEVKPFTDFKAGKMFIRYSWDMIVDIKEFEKISTQGEC